ncbi:MULTISPECIES: hypothetical protein [Gordonia]|jgi:hypothetical protein|uniref:Uncharacterized protein n=1 Tax=Gordonia pseudamarae TaxID=2831662 RepID=A0ABX6IMW7_9ACTN|nr:MULTISPECIES: hypothetical protein [Gordonia]MBD0021215.1 hypothetical protein [Gordonia sp. (in: high G+C Gram-positive bacteria)]QHN36461.1 hypothetical protein GII31_17795 [Gordonia pseudamarae]
MLRPDMMFRLGHDDRFFGLVPDPLAAGAANPFGMSTANTLVPGPGGSTMDE